MSRSQPILATALVAASAVVLAGALAAGGAVADDDARAPDAADPEFGARIRPFLDRYCGDCHDDDAPSGGLDLERFASAEQVRAAPSTWQKVVEMLSSAEMPPADEAQPTLPERAAVVAWASRAVEAGRAAAARNPGRVTIRRLNRAEYNHSVHDLLAVSSRPADAFPDDDVGYGFDVIGDVLTVPPVLVERYLEAAERVAAEALPDDRPLEQRIECEDAEREGSGGTQRGFARLNTSGMFRARVEVSVAGEYVFRMRCFGEQAGPEPCRAVFRIGRRNVATVDVPNEANEPKVYEWRGRLEPGTTEIGVGFINDYYRPNDPDPKQRDRNMAFDWMELVGPTTPPPPSRSIRRILIDQPEDDLPETRHAAARAVLRPLAQKAWRRPVTTEELDRLIALTDLAAEQGEGFRGQIRLALTAILCSPHFIYRVEVHPAPTDAGAAHPIGDWQLASRLSYFLWSSLPDDALRKRAARGTLRTDLDAQVARMLDDPKASRLVRHFAGQWLQLRRLPEASPDPARFPDFDDDLRAAMRIESEMLFETIVRENRPITELLDARFTFVNARLADHYGIELEPTGLDGDEERFRRVAVPPERGGILGHASVLTITSDPTRTSPVKRGKWVLEVLLDDSPPPPPPGNDSLSDDPAVRAKTLRKQLEAHRDKPACRSCHARMDPLGFGLERFDPVGARRETDPEGRPIDDSGELPDGSTFAGLAELRDVLLERPRVLARALAKALLIYATGRGPIEADDVALDRIVDQAGPDWRFADLVLAVVRSAPFQMHVGDATRPKPDPVPDPEPEPEPEPKPAPKPEGSAEEKAARAGERAAKAAKAAGARANEKQDEKHPPKQNEDEDDR